MKIVDIREAVVSISSPVRNAFIDFSKMTASVVAVVTDQVKDGKPVFGYGFNSNGRYAASGLSNVSCRACAARSRRASSTTPATISIRTGSGRR